MKSSLTFACVLLAVFMAPAQNVFTVRPMVAQTNVTDNTTFTLTNATRTVDVRDFNQVGLHFKFALNDAGTDPCAFNFLYSGDGTNYNTTAPLTVSIAPAGTTAVITNFSLNIGAISQIRLHSITAGNNTADMTNVDVYISVKPNRREYR